jgi:hypothetical protein
MGRVGRLSRLGGVIFVVAWMLVSSVGVAADLVYPNAEAVEPLKPGNPVPSVSVQSLDLKSVDLSKVLRDQGALLVFYRGGW